MTTHPTTFTDAAGRDWHPTLTPAAVAVLAEIGFDLPALVQSPNRLTNSVLTPDRLGRLLWTMCEEQAGARGLTPETFAAGFNSLVVVEAAAVAAVRAVARYYPASPAGLALGA